MNNGKRRNQNSIKIVIIRKSIITLAIIRFFHFEYLINLRNRLIITIINKKEAFKWFKISAEQGMAFGMINVAIFLRVSTETTLLSA